MKPFRLTQQPPRPLESALLPLNKCVEDAQRSPARHWEDTQIVGLLRYAVEFLKQGQWDNALDNAEKALTKETRRNNGRCFAERFSEILIALHTNARGHDQRNAAFVVSLKTEIAAKKEERRDEPTTGERDKVPATRVSQAEGTGRTVAGTASLPTPLGSIAVLDGARMVEGIHGSVARNSREGEQERVEAIAASPRELRILYWSAILSRDPSRIRDAVRAARGAGLNDLLETTKRQLNNDLAEPHRAARAEAVAEWERDG